MKKKIAIIILIILLLIGTFFIGRQVGLNTEDGKTKTTIREEAVSTHDIKSTLTSSGQVEAKTTEKQTLTTTKYFSAMCVEDEDILKAGENILQYTDGTYLTAPYDCVIVSKNVPETSGKCTSSNYIEISNLDTLITTISINENQINNVEVGQEVEITLTSNENKKYNGTITKVDSIGTYATSGATFSATIEFENDDTIKIGMSLSCTIILKEKKEVASLPIDAVYENNEGKQYVNKIKEDGSTEEIIVETGVADENYVEITSGLNLNDKVQIITETTESTSSSNENGKGNFRGGFGEGMSEGREKAAERGNMPMGEGGQPPEMSNSQGNRPEGGQ